MVTHHWGHLFSHLIAAVVADALDATLYSHILERMRPGRIRELMLQVQEHGTWGSTYWISAFCVNHHRSICGSFVPDPLNPHNLDSVGFRMHACNCGLEKYTNGMLCELNKFDDMLNLLSHRVHGLSHVIVVDVEFNVFSRAWCVAEMME